MSEGMVVWMYRGYSWKRSITIRGHSVSTWQVNQISEAYGKRRWEVGERRERRDARGEGREERGEEVRISESRLYGLP